MPAVSICPARITAAYKEQVVELAEKAMAEFLHVSQAQSPLWLVPVPHAENPLMEQLNLAQYLRQFPDGAGLRTRRGMKTEATRDRVLVEADGPRIVESFMNPCTWLDTFSCMVSRADILAIVESGVPGNRHGALLIMQAEIQVVSPIAVPARRLHFLRYCKQQPYQGFWAIVDVSVDNLGINPAPPSSIRPRRRPSGVLIRSQQGGQRCQVTAVEHLEYYTEDPVDQQPLMGTLVSSGLAFGAQRWLATLLRESPNLPTIEPRPPPPPLRVVPRLLNLADRVAIHTFTPRAPAANGGPFTPRRRDHANGGGGAPPQRPWRLDNNN